MTKQGEILFYAGIIECKSESSEYARITDLSDYNIVVSLQKANTEIARLKIEKFDGYFTAKTDTANLDSGKLKIEVALTLNGTDIIATASNSVTLASSPLGRNIGGYSEDRVVSNEYGASLDGGEYSYIIKMAQQSNETISNCKFDNGEDVLIFDIGKTLVGLTAYQVAVKNGFEGTEQEWLESLKGDAFTYDDFTSEQLKEIADIVDIEVDESPTVGSGNPVSSGGVYEALKNINTESITSIGNIYSGKNVVADAHFTTNEGDFITGSGSFYKGSGDSKVEVAYNDEIPTKISELTNDSSYTTLANVLNTVYSKSETYTQREVESLVSDIQAQLDAIVDGDASSAIDTFNEIKAFLSSFTDTEDLASILLALKNEIEAKIPTEGDGININDDNEIEVVLAEDGGLQNTIDGVAINLSDNSIIVDANGINVNTSVMATKEYADGLNLDGINMFKFDMVDGNLIVTAPTSTTIDFEIENNNLIAKW